MRRGGALGASVQHALGAFAVHRYTLNMPIIKEISADLSQPRVWQSCRWDLGALEKLNNGYIGSHLTLICGCITL